MASLPAANAPQLTPSLSTGKRTPDVPAEEDLKIKLPCPNDLEAGLSRSNAQLPPPATGTASGSSTVAASVPPAAMTTGSSTVVVASLPLASVVWRPDPEFVAFHKHVMSSAWPTRHPPLTAGATAEPAVNPTATQLADEPMEPAEPAPEEPMPIPSEAFLPLKQAIHDAKRSIDLCVQKAKEAGMSQAAAKRRAEEASRAAAESLQRAILAEQLEQESAEEVLRLKRDLREAAQCMQMRFNPRSETPPSHLAQAFRHYADALGDVVRDMNKHVPAGEEGRTSHCRVIGEGVQAATEEEA